MGGDAIKRLAVFDGENSMTHTTDMATTDRDGSTGAVGTSIQGGAGAVALRGSGDEAAAARLRVLIADADDGLRRILKAGLYIQHIADRLPWGKLGDWLADYCPDVPRSTAMRWLGLARNVVAHLQKSHDETIVTALSNSAEAEALPFFEVVAADPETLGDQAKAVRAAFDELIQGKTATQLLFQFRDAAKPVQPGPSNSEALRAWATGLGKVVGDLKRWGDEMNRGIWLEQPMTDLVTVEAEAAAFLKSVRLVIKDKKGAKANL
jgi:hypothetical protein